MGMTKRWAAVALAVSSLPAHAEPGYRWETTMEMEGMKLPGMGGRMTVCAPVKGNETPGMDDKCVPIETRHTGNRFYWKAKCEGALTTGEFVYNGDESYKGTVTVEEDGERMTMKMTGKRLGKCDYQPPRIPVFAAPKLPAMPGIDCDKEIKSLNYQLVFGKMPGGGALPCAGKKKAMCAQLANPSRDDFTKLVSRQKDEAQFEKSNPGYHASQGVITVDAALGECKLTLSGIQGNLCKRAKADNDMDFLYGHCPAEMDALCASGRDYSGYCGKPAKRDENTGQESRDKGVVDGLKKLKGLFSF